MIKTYTTEEVAELAHCHIKTVQRWIREQRLPAHKIGRRWLVAERDLQRFFALEPQPPVPMK
ncbi:MAG: helix-turn-helix domain-containing protein [Candidatus Competibacteraceae bacterium]